jgi:hypothetical protein
MLGPIQGEGYYLTGQWGLECGCLICRIVGVRSTLTFNVTAFPLSVRVCMNQGTSVSIISMLSGCVLENWGFNSSQQQRIFPLASTSRLVVGSTWCPVQWVLMVLSLGVKHGLGMMLITHPNLVLRSKRSSYYTCSPSKLLHGM